MLKPRNEIIHKHVSDQKMMKKMANYNAVIIGGGLVAGATLSKRGQSVLLLEQHYIPGGCATAFKRKNYLMEVGLHEIDGLHNLDGKVEIFEYLEVFKKH